jgi:hypothetical protein
MAERKLRIDVAEATVVPRPRGGMHVSDPESATPSADPAPAEVSAEEPATPGRQTLDRALPDEPLAAGRKPPHELERLVQQELISQPAVSFSSLVIRRIDGGVCLEGVLETNDELPDVERLIRSVADVDRILNRLVVRKADDA